MKATKTTNVAKMTPRSKSQMVSVRNLHLRTCAGCARLADADPDLLEVLNGWTYSLENGRCLLKFLNHIVALTEFRLDEGGESLHDYDDFESEQGLAEALDRYTDPMHPDYDREFDEEIRALRPDWFGEEPAR